MPTPQIETEISHKNAMRSGLSGVHPCEPSLPQGKGRKQEEDVVRAYFSGKKTDEGGRSTRFGLKDYQSLLGKRAEVESIVDNLYGRNMAYAQELGRRKFMTANAQARENLGIPAAYGAPAVSYTHSPSPRDS